MSKLNKITLLGQINSDLEIKTDQEFPLAKFTLCVDRPTMQGATQTKKDYFTIIAWRDLALKIEKSAENGALALIEGRIHTRSYTTQEGIRKYVTEIEARDYISLPNTSHSSTSNPTISKETNLESPALNSSPDIQESEFNFGDTPEQVKSDATFEAEDLNSVPF